jgi:hypothetical protein
MDEIGVYAVSGDDPAYSIHMSHRKNPAIANKLKSLCILDGNSTKAEDLDCGVIKLPGGAPESEVFSYVHDNIDTLSMRLAVALHLNPQKERHVKNVVDNIAITNRDPHVLFSQIGRDAGLIPENIVCSAFISLWIVGNEKETDRVSKFILSAMA